MNILIDTVRVAGFRGIKELELSLARVTVLIGTNNSGKTSLLKAIDLILGDYNRYLSEEDFHITADEKRVEEIIVDARIVPLDGDGERKNKFDEEWATEFGDKIKAEANGNQYVALRTRSKPNLIKGGFDTLRFTLEKWPEKNVWKTERVKETKISSRFLSMPFISIEAQRDIHKELKEKSSHIGKILSGVIYKPSDVTELELLIKNINDKAVEDSAVLKNLKMHLIRLNQSFSGSGSAEITPFPKKIRDLSKHFTVHFGESANGSFSMEYHGMGTRSWASMLTVKAFTDLMAEKHQEEVKPFFPILAAEEPEAHLHPNAQKTIYRQLAESTGQLIVSTHSPYLAALADQSELRCLQKMNENISVHCLSLKKGTEEHRRLQREVIHSRGEILFSKALVLCEGETEEQALPLLFQKFFKSEPCVLGVNFIGVGGGGKYLPFLKFARDFATPVFIFSDGEESVTRALKKQYESVFGAIDITSCPKITILDGTDFEEYLISSGFKEIIETTIKKLDGDDAIDKWIIKREATLLERKKTGKPPCTNCGQPIFEDVLRDYKSSGGYERALLEILHDGKTRFAPAIAEKLCELDLEKLPPKILEFLNKIKTGMAIC